MGEGQTACYCVLKKGFPMKESSLPVVSAVLDAEQTQPRRFAGGGSVSSPVLAKPVNAYAELKKLIKQQGLLKKQPLYYTYKLITTMSILTLCITSLIIVHQFWFQLINAVVFAVISAQLGFLGHDGGHRQIFHSTRKNEMLTLLTGNLLIGMSNGWWLTKHNAHHSHPNEIDMDPDLDLGVLAFSDADVRRKKGVLRLIIKHQKYFFFPLLALLGVDLQKRSLVYLWKIRGKDRVIEALLLALHHLLYFGLLFLCLNPWQAIIFFLLHQSLFGLFLGSAFAPNHKGMPLVEHGSRIDFLRRQVLTSRNVHGSVVNDFWYGGLNYQVEHHLFPSMPRNNLKKAQKIVRQYCQEQQIGYYETSMLQSFREILHFLHQISAPLRMTTM